MKYKITLLCFIISTMSLLAQTDGKRLLPVCMESEKPSLKYEFDYDTLDRISSFRSIIITLMNEVPIITSNQFTYVGDSLIVVEHKQVVNNEDSTFRKYSFLIRGNSMQVLTDNTYKQSMNINKRGQLLNSETIMENGDGKMSSFEYDKDGNISKLISTIKQDDSETRFTYVYTYLPKSNEKDAFTSVKGPLWLKHYMFESLIPYLNNLQLFDMDIISNQDEPVSEQVNVTYEYNEAGYPVLIKSSGNTESSLKITYREAN